MVILSCERKTGVFTDSLGKEIPYDNYYFMCDSGDATNMIFGHKIKQIKVSVKNFQQFYKGNVESTKGQDLIFAFDQEAHLIGIYGSK